MCEKFAQSVLLNSLCRNIHQGNVDRGFYDGLDPTNEYHVSTKLMLIVGELSEAVEEMRKGDKEAFDEEIADVAIRLFDLCGFLKIDLAKEITEKVTYNATRGVRHGKKF